VRPTSPTGELNGFTYALEGEGLSPGPGASSATVAGRRAGRGKDREAIAELEALREERDRGTTSR